MGKIAEDISLMLDRSEQPYWLIWNVTQNKPASPSVYYPDRDEASAKAAYWMSAQPMGDVFSVVSWEESKSIVH